MPVNVAMNKPHPSPVKPNSGYRVCYRNVNESYIFFTRHICTLNANVNTETQLNVVSKVKGQGDYSAHKISIISRSRARWKKIMVNALPINTVM